MCSYISPQTVDDSVNNLLNYSEKNNENKKSSTKSFDLTPYVVVLFVIIGGYLLFSKNKNEADNKTGQVTLSPSPNNDVNYVEKYRPMVIMFLSDYQSNSSSATRSYKIGFPSFTKDAPPTEVYGLPESIMNYSILDCEYSEKIETDRTFLHANLTCHIRVEVKTEGGFYRPSKGRVSYYPELNMYYFNVD
jgi:hypothetical protein